ncbi:MAG: CDP-2,3-bis-(O-geranylgeranyl)-sn-glycerol synthase [Candidatus Micrarchaeia archaeon]
MIAGLIYSVFVYPLIFILPAYVANGAPVIFGGGIPLDFGKKIRGKRIFGDHKTVRGLLAGILSGSIIAGIEAVFLPFMLVEGIAMSFGAHAGDLLGSFAKRQMGLKEGASVKFLDQYLFFFFALAFAYPFGNMPNASGLLFLVIITYLLHVSTNKVAYVLKLKKVPW